MAAPARRQSTFTAQEVLEIVMENGSDDEREEMEVQQHDEESEDELFEDAVADESSQDEQMCPEADDTFSQASDSVVSDNKSNLQLFDSDTEIANLNDEVAHDLLHSDLNDEVAHDLLHSDWDDGDETVVYDTEPTIADQDDPAYHVDTDVDEDIDDQDVWVRDIPATFPRVPDFRGTPGLKVNLTDDPSPLEVFQLFIDETIIRKIKRETNRYARSCIQAKQSLGPLPPKSMWSTWTPVTVGDMRNFLAICIHMGIIKKPTVNDYWSTDATIYSAYASQIMSRDRFKYILAFLHVNDNANFIPHNEDGHDPIFKIRPFVDHLQAKFQEVYEPEKEICLDEAMCPFKGRSRFKVYMKDKPTKWGFKLYEVCESKTGYVYRFEMFCQDKRHSNKPFDVVLRLLQPMLNKGYHVYMDNYYCEPKICSALSRHNMMVCGTVRKNIIQMPRDLGDERLQRGQVTYRRHGDVIACRWKDKKDVSVLSTLHKPELERVQCRFEEKDKPMAVIAYIKKIWLVLI